MKNENRSGFKKTKVGWIPEEWGLSTFGDEFEIQLGKMLSKKASQGNDPQPYLANANVRWGSFELMELREMSFSEKERVKFALRKGDLLVCEGGEIGRCAIWDEDLTPCYFQKALHRLRPLSENINIVFSMHFLHQAFSSARIRGLIGETSIAHFTRETFISFPVSTPPLEEQEVIAEILECWDSGIRSLEKKIELKRNIKKGLMQKLLSGQSRLSGFTGEWETVKLGTICKRMTTGKLDANAMVENGTYRFYTCAKDYCRINEFAFDDEALLVSGNGAHVGYVHYYKGKFNAYQRTYVLTGFSGDIQFIRKILEKYLKKRIHQEKNDGNTPYIKIGTLRDMKIPTPTLEEQKAIAEVLIDADAEIQKLEEKLARWKDQKKYLLNELVTGSIRVSAA